MYFKLIFLLLQISFHPLHFHQVSTGSSNGSFTPRRPGFIFRERIRKLHAQLVLQTHLETLLCLNSFSSFLSQKEGGGVSNAFDWNSSGVGEV